MQKAVEGFVTAAVWAGVLITLPVSYFYVFKKPKSDEQILIRRMGRLQSPSSGTVAKLPLIDTETRADLSIQVTVVKDRELFTMDKCGLIVGAEVRWRLTNPVLAFTNATDYKKVAADEFDLEIQRLICKSFIREVATEKKKLERKLIQQVSMNTHKIGVVVEAIQLNILPSKNQPFLNPTGATVPMDGVGGTFERINNSNTSSMVQDFVAGLGDHPGFANIVSSMIQTVGDIHQTNIRDLSETEQKSINLTIDQIIEALRSKKIKISNGSVVLRITDGDIRLSGDGIQKHPRGRGEADCIVTATNENLAQILKGNSSYQAAFANGHLSVEGDVKKLQQLLAFV